MGNPYTPTARVTDGMDTDKLLTIQQAEIDRVLKENAELRAKLERAKEVLSGCLPYAADYGSDEAQAIAERARATLEEIND